MPSAQTTESPRPAGEETMRLALMLAREEALPLAVGRLAWSPDGTLALRAENTNGVHFSFLFRGLPFTVEIAEAKAPRVALRGELGKLPFTAEDPRDRRLLKRIAAATERLPRGALRVSPQQDLQVQAEAEIPERPTPARVIATVTALLLDLLPFLDLAEEALARRARSPLG